MRYIRNKEQNHRGYVIFIIGFLNKRELQIMWQTNAGYKGTDENQIKLRKGKKILF